ncbi:MAG: adenosylcobinamide-GDP ribazoletransferase [Polyangiaceae bacterium]
MRAARAAVVFLTRVPVGGSPYSDEDWRWSAAHFPLVGAAVGAVVGTVDGLLLPLGTLASAVLALGASLLVTGALHEDGLADTADALGGGHTREKIFAILKDSRIGVFGGCALVFSFAARAALIARLGGAAAAALVLAGAVARLAPVWLIATMKYVTDAAVSRSAGIAAAGPAQAAVATLWTALTLGALAATRSIALERAAIAVGVAALVTLLTAWRYQTRAGGITGDFLGATEQLCEIAILATMAWA